MSKKKILALLALAALLGGALAIRQEHVQKVIPIQNQYVQASVSDIDTTELFNLTNHDRALNDVKPLTRNPLLDNSAQAKCDDMVARNYWDHLTPDGKEPWVFIDAQGIKFTQVGENLAVGFTNSQAVETGWLNSPGHKENIVRSSFTEVGFGVCYSADYVATGGPSLVVVEHFDRP